MQAHGEVELDILSGMPNPTWMLTEAEGQSLLQQLATLPRAPAGELAGQLGYRGFIVRIGQRDDFLVIHVQGGTVYISQGSKRRYARDSNRAMERWLFNTGKARLKSEIANIVEQDLR